MKLASLLRAFARDDRGVTAIEYGLIAAGVAVAITAAVQNMGTALKATFVAIQQAL